MTAKELKASILDLAIRGKLVPQDPNDEPAAKLLARIVAEKAKLVKSGKLKKEKPLPPITDDDKPFDLPHGWAWCWLKDVSIGIGGRENQILAKEVKPDGLVPVVSQGVSLIDGYCDARDKAIIDIPVVMFGDHTRNVKYVDFAFVIGADGTKFFKPLVDAKWLYYWTRLTADLIASRGYGRHWGLLNERPLALPPLAEQKRIVEKVEQLMPLVERYGQAEEKRRQLIATLPEALKKSILKSAVEGKLIPQDPNDEPAEKLLARIAAEKAKLIKSGKLKKEKPLPPIADNDKPFALPYGWAWCRAGDLVQIISGVSYEKSDVIATGSVRIFRGGNVKDDATVVPCDDDVRLPDAYRDATNAVRRGDIILVASTGSSAVIGRPGIVVDDFEDTQIGAFLKIVRTNVAELIPYMHLIFRSELYRSCVRAAVKGIGIKNLKVEYVSNLLIPLPPLAEQKRIVERVKELLMRLDASQVATVIK